MKKIFLVSEHILPSQDTTGYLFDKLYKNLKQQYGTELKLIVKEDKNLLIEDAILVADVNLNKKKLVQRFFFELIISFNFLIKILRNVKKGDVVFTGTTPIFLLPIIYIAKKLKNFKWILLIHDVFPENLVAANVISSKNVFYKVIKYCFDKFYAAAEKRIVIGQDMKELIDHKVHKNDAVIVQNWIDHNDIEVQDKKENSLLKRIAWEDNVPIFNFFGNIGRVQGIDNIIQALKLIPQNKRPKVLFIGSGAYENELKQALIDFNDDNIKYVGRLDPSRKSDGLCAGDIAIVTLAEGMYGLGVPSKAYYSMAADKQILSIMDEASEVSTMVKKYNIGWIVEAGNPEKLAAKFLEISDNFHKQNYRSSRKVLIEHYSEQIAMKKIISMINEFLK